LNGFELFMPFPFGLGGVVILNVVMYVGILSVSWSRVISAKAGGMIELSLLDGLSWTKLSILVFGFLKKDALIFFWLTFVGAFTSFSVPLIVGGRDGETLEVLIYRLAFARGELGLAALYAVGQMIFLFGIGTYLWRYLKPEGAG